MVCQLTGHEPFSAVVGELNGVDTAEVSQHVLLEEAGAARQPASLEFLLHERLPGELSAGQEAHRGAHTAALKLLHDPPAKIRPAVLCFHRCVLLICSLTHDCRSPAWLYILGWGGCPCAR